LRAVFTGVSTTMTRAPWLVMRRARSSTWGASGALLQPWQYD
jgi:hypothetical protein